MRATRTSSNRMSARRGTTRTRTQHARKPKAKPAASAPSQGGAWAAVFAPRAPDERRYWLVKSEPSVFSFEDLLRAPGKTTTWDGVRNFAARNFLRDGMKLGDRVFFYHSMTDQQSIVGICEVVREGYPDATAFDAADPHYDPESDRTDPTWYVVDVRAVAQFTHPVTLVDIKQRPDLAGMALLRVGRLSVSPVSADEWDTICNMASRR
jgi:predicted RNA-binding protein with PUA-like domain